MTSLRFTIAAFLLASAGLMAGEVTIKKDITYLDPDRKEKADLYLPAEAPRPGEKRPGIVIIHGGGWTGGDKGAKREINIGTTLASHGYVCISINYALAGEGHPTWPTNIHDCKRAVRWLRKNAEKYQIDTEHIGAIGGSAGGHLVAMLAVCGPEVGLEPEQDSNISSRVQAAVPMYGRVGSVLDRDHVMLPKKLAEAPELYKLAAPVSHVTRDDPPMLVLHGTADKTVPVEESKLFAARLAEVGVEHELVLIEGAPHTFDLQPKQRDLRPLVVGFFDRHLKTKSTSR